MKILIFSKVSELKNSGGPGGYLYNIHKYLLANPSSEIYFLPEEFILRTTFFSKIKRLLIRIIGIFFCVTAQNKKLFFLYKLYYTTLCFDKKTIDYLNSFDFIHIHVAPYYRMFFKKNKLKSKTIITSHSPEPFTDELIKSLGLESFSKTHSKLLNVLRRREAEFYDLCDFIMFPVPEAKEPYEVISKFHKEAFERNARKFFYVPTALCDVEKIEGIDPRIEQIVKENEPVFCYIGRHNEVKGYDFLKKAAISIWEKIPDAKFVIGGNEGPLYGIHDSRWIELGWVNTPCLLNSVDAFILPNQQTYFDLILLETLRQGTPVILTRTGGNKWFEGKNIDGMFFFEFGDLDGIVKYAELIQSFKQNGKIESIRGANRTFFRQEFSMEKYIENYLNTLNKLLSEKK